MPTKKGSERNSIDALVSDIRSRAVSPLADARAKSSSGVREESFRGFGGGGFGRGGAEAEFSDAASRSGEDYIENVPVQAETSFGEAYARARESGAGEFGFGGERYSTEYDPDAKVGPRKVSRETVANIRNVYDADGRIMKDSTRVEPYVGQIPGRRKRRDAALDSIIGGSR